VTADALHTQAETARYLAGDKKAHCLMMSRVTGRHCWPPSRRRWPPRTADHRTAPAAGISWPHAAQVLRIRRDSGPTHGLWTHKQIAYGPSPACP
jgi:hypothetical protein